MRRIFLIGLAVLVLSGAVHGKLGDIQSSFRLPHSICYGVAKSRTMIYVVARQSPDRIYCLSNTGSVLTSYPTPYSSGNRGLAYSAGGHIWVGSSTNRRVYDVESGTGSVYLAWNAGSDPYGLAPHCTGDGGAGTTAIFSRDSSPNIVKRHNMNTGSVYSSFMLIHAYSSDIAYDWRNKLIWAYYFSPPAVYGYNATTGFVVASFARPASAMGLGMAHSGRYLYISMSNGYLYRVHCPATVGVAPASMGKVKAMYR